MSTIQELTTKDPLASGDQVLIWDTVNGQSRKASMQSVKTFVKANFFETLDPVKLPQYLLASLPSASANAYSVVYCLNGNAGAACLAVSNGINWKVIAIGANVS